MGLRDSSAVCCPVTGGGRRFPHSRLPQGKRRGSRCFRGPSRPVGRPVARWEVLVHPLWGRERCPCRHPQLQSLPLFLDSRGELLSQGTAV